jgi:hypothetical protein
MWFDRRIVMRRSPIHGTGSFATHPIRAGEEMTTDYAYCEAYPGYRLEPCICGSGICRGRVTGDDWQIPELQRRYPF